ncbi:MAG TPA: RNA 2',3'-cyclic phosphodiesterase [Elusimicrobiota bacterium]|nr:RNA 2',3'-cyclic phosphodiesterase [Elusimicrobiota bacterium]
MRLFVAIPPVSGSLGWVREVKDLLRPRLRGSRWVDEENVHVTLKFLGEVPVERLDQVESVLSGVARSFSEFPLELKGLGAFPSVKRPQIVWAGVGEGSSSVVSLAAAVEEALETAGFVREERTFHPHATLARIKEPVVRRESLWPPEWNTRRFSVFTVRNFCLMESRLRPEGPVYQKGKNYLLGPRRG